MKFFLKAVFSSLFFFSFAFFTQAQTILDTDWSGGDYSSFNNLDPANSAGQLFLKNNAASFSLVGDITTEAVSLGMVEYNNDLYIAFHTNPKNGTPGTIIKYNDLTGLASAAYSVPTGQGLGDIRVLNGKIYVTSIDSGGSNGEIYTFNGSSWQSFTTSPIAMTGLIDIDYYNNNFYSAGYAGGTPTLLSSANGQTGWQSVYTYPGYMNRFTQIKEFNGLMFFTPQTSNATGTMYFPEELFSFDGSSATPVDVSSQNENMEVTDMEVFNGFLYLIVWERTNNVTGMYRSLDGVNFSPVSFFGATKAWRLEDLIVYDGKLYAVEYGTPSSLIYQSADGANWSQVGTIPTGAVVSLPAAWYEHAAMGTYRGRLYASPPASGNLYVSSSASSGDLTSSTKSVAALSGNAFNFDASLPAGTALKFQARSAGSADAITGKTFVGPDGAGTSYFTTSGASLNSIHNGDTFFQYKVEMTTADVSKTAYLNEVSLGEAAFDFSIGAIFSPLTVIRGQSSTATIDINSVSGGSSQSVNLSVTGLPAGAAAVFSPTSCNPTCETILTITADNSVATGTFALTATAVSGAVSKSANFDLAINDPAPAAAFDFSVSAMPSSEAIFQGERADIVIDAALLSGSATSVNFSASGLASGITSSFSQNSCSPACQSIMTLSSVSSVSTGNYTINVNGTGGGITRTAIVALTINASSTSSTSTTPTTPPAAVPPPIPQTGNFDFSLSLGSASTTLLQGQSGQVVVAANLVSGTTKTISFTASSTGVSVSFNPFSCSPACSSTMTISVASTTPAGDYVIAVFGNEGALTKTAVFNLAVTVPVAGSFVIYVDSSQHFGL